ncbi:hypothetical protein QVD17_05165 [Tagetes erecta]|uniref:Uncharacterized protein n=1 Tax=Tagetes erecta TaxID=13708 RepID=A0AAD8LBH8_TARER|nr:hypothetical protein QVD17_05165 [Tagetes erecta]
MKNDLCCNVRIRVLNFFIQSAQVSNHKPDPDVSIQYFWFRFSSKLLVTNSNSKFLQSLSILHFPSLPNDFAPSSPDIRPLSSLAQYLEAQIRGTEFGVKGGDLHAGKFPYCTYGIATFWPTYNSLLLTSLFSILKVLNFEIGTSNIVYRFLEDLLIQLKEVATIGDHLDIEVCMDIMDLLYEKEETTTLYTSPHSLAASILVASYVIMVPKQRWEFPLIPWVKYGMACKEEEIIQDVTYILKHVLQPSSC